MKSSQTSWFSLFILCSVIGAGFYYHVPLAQFINKEYHQYFSTQPCVKPLTYSLGEFDTRFGITKKDFISSLAKAEGIWEKPFNKNLFSFQEEKGSIIINLIYDTRQRSTNKLQTIGLTIDAKRAIFENMKNEYDQLKNSYQAQNVVLEVKLATYNKDLAAYNTEVSYWNSKGGAPAKTYSELQRTKSDLDVEASAINQLSKNQNAKADLINQKAMELNAAIKELNLNVQTYNTTGQLIGTEFNEGEYIVQGNDTKINIYQFESNQKLVRVLAHEFGHALGLEHIDNPKAIMYRLNEGTNEMLTKDDLAALKVKCGEK